VDDELARLPESLRAPVVLCYLEGLTHEEAARQLGWPVGTVRSRMARSRDRLRQRLARRGFGGDDVALAVSLSSPPVSTSLIDATVVASLGLARSNVATLAKGVLAVMMLARWKTIGLAALVVLAGTAGFQTLSHRINRFHTNLAISARQNARLESEIKVLRAELEAIRAGNPPPAGAKPALDAPAATDSADAQPRGRRVPAADSPSYFRVSDKLLLVISPQANRIVAFDPTIRAYRGEDTQMSPIRPRP
jgi:hypothetical protein